MGNISIAARIVVFAGNLTGVTSKFSYSYLYPIGAQKIDRLMDGVHCNPEFSFILLVRNILSRKSEKYIGY